MKPLKDEYQYYCAEARFIRAYSYSMLCDLYGSTPFVDETMEVGDMPEQATREEIYNFVVSELEELTTLLKEPQKERICPCGPCSSLVLAVTCLLECRNLGRKE